MRIYVGNNHQKWFPVFSLLLQKCRSIAAQFPAPISGINIFETVFGGILVGLFSWQMYFSAIICVVTRHVKQVRQHLRFQFLNAIKIQIPFLFF